ncbi:dihydrolipoyl dehydrogenase [Lentisphaera profundi]|uniref:Dihydrolipoyl dehydrogenase n=1 Tax=Lentisphaera profundi TaxID=1658616 RepID=A0ABY7VSD7_9BACT|nr:dihydrolipoyl dehydrogenase [Lentisphaera profundi]WDE96811.1 dihydrolipoyl dehydrogenase [Lentisphaera profundi]
MEKFDLIIIGGGPGGYVAAIRGAQMGMKVACVEKYSTLGGTCLNVGCIPSKALLDSSEHYHQAKEKFAIHGIQTGDLKVDFTQMIKRKTDVVSNTTEGINYLFSKNNVTRLEGLGSFVDANTVKVTAQDGSETQYHADKFILATGSKPVDLPFMPCDKKRIITSTEALCLEEIPKDLVLIGGGVIGLELGSVYARLGTNVTVIEFMDRIVPPMDKELGKTLQRSLKKLGIKFQLSTKVTGATVEGDKVTVTAENKKGQELSFTGDYALVCVGRKPFTNGLNLDAAGVELGDRGFITVNKYGQTSAPHIFAIGDVIGGAMLAHKAEEEGVCAVEFMNGEKPQLDHNLIPGVVYTWPEVASVGKTEEQLKEAGVKFKTGKFPFRASGRARASEESEGFVKVLADSETDRILGVHMIGPRCADLIAEAVLAMEYKASAEDVARVCHAHPTYTECLKEAALMATGNRPIHI